MGVGDEQRLTDNATNIVFPEDGLVEAMGRHRAAKTSEQDVARWAGHISPRSCSSLFLTAHASTAPVMVVKADDIVFAEIAAGLDLDHVERDFARVFEPVCASQRD